MRQRARCTSTSSMPTVTSSITATGWSIAARPTLHCRVKQDLVRLWSLCWAGWILVLYVSNILMIVIILSDKSSLSDKIILPFAPCYGLPGFHYHASCLSFLRLISIVISLITSIVFDDSCKLWNFSLCIFSLLLLGPISYVWGSISLAIHCTNLHSNRFIKVSLVGIVQHSTWLKESRSQSMKHKCNHSHLTRGRAWLGCEWAAQ